ncbi:MAG: hypothetical protein GY679_03595 [Mycoplasma sp.]|nr:hypothetical protein [Mycoplasma sp.]
MKEYLKKNNYRNNKNNKFAKTIIYSGQRYEIHLDTNREGYFQGIIKQFNKYILNLNVKILINKYENNYRYIKQTPFYFTN